MKYSAPNIKTTTSETLFKTEEIYTQKKSWIMNIVVLDWLSVYFVCF